MTDTGQIPGEGLPENAGTVEQPGVLAPDAYTYLSETTAEDEDLLLPGAQGAWGNEVPPPPPEPVVEAVHEPGPHEMSGRDSGSVDVGAVRPPAPRRPLHLGPPIPDTFASPVRSLADRGPADAPVRQQPAPPAATEHHGAPRADEAVPQEAAPWGAQAPASSGDPAAETVVPAPETVAAGQPASAPGQEAVAPEREVGAGAVVREADAPAHAPVAETAGAAQAVVARVTTEAAAATAGQPAGATATPSTETDADAQPQPAQAGPMTGTELPDVEAGAHPAGAGHEGAAEPDAGDAPTGQVADDDGTVDPAAAGPEAVVGEDAAGADRPAESAAAAQDGAVAPDPAAATAGDVPARDVTAAGDEHAPDAGAVVPGAPAEAVAAAGAHQPVPEAGAAPAAEPAQSTAGTAPLTEAGTEAGPGPQAEDGGYGAQVPQAEGVGYAAQTPPAGEDATAGAIAAEVVVTDGQVAVPVAGDATAADDGQPDAPDAGQGPEDGSAAVADVVAGPAAGPAPTAETGMSGVAAQTGASGQPEQAGEAGESGQPEQAVEPGEAAQVGEPGEAGQTAAPVPGPESMPEPVSAPEPEAVPAAEAGAVQHVPSPEFPQAADEPVGAPVAGSAQGAENDAAPEVAEAHQTAGIAEAVPASEGAPAQGSGEPLEGAAPMADAAGTHVGAAPAPGAAEVPEGAVPVAETVEVPQGAVAAGTQVGAAPAPGGAEAPGGAAPVTEEAQFLEVVRPAEAVQDSVPTQAPDAVEDATAAEVPAPAQAPLDAVLDDAAAPEAPVPGAEDALSTPLTVAPAAPAGPAGQEDAGHLAQAAGAAQAQPEPSLAQGRQDQSARPDDGHGGQPVPAVPPAQGPQSFPAAQPDHGPQPAAEVQASSDGAHDADPATEHHAPQGLEPEAAGTVPAPREAGPEPVHNPVENTDGPDTRAAGQEDQEDSEVSTAAVAEERQSTGPAAPPYDDAEREAVLKVMRERRDIRNGFRGDPIPHEVLLRVLEAAHTAPSVGHSQPWDFVVIRSAETRRTMHELAVRQREAYAKSLPKGRAKQFKELKIEAILDTPVNIVVTADPTRGGRHTLGRHTQPQMAPYSAALAVENLWLAARAEGLGVGWVSFFDEREMVRALGLPEHLEVIAYLCVGYVDAFPDEPELMQAGWSKRRPLSWVVHEETYGRRALPGEEPHDLLAETVAQIRPLDAKALGEAWERQKRMTKPAGALGMLEIISAQLCGLSRQCPPPIPEPAAVAVFAGDHGVHAQGVTPWPQEVTGQMVANFLGGGAVCNAFATQVGAEVCVVDVGVAADLPATPGLLPRKVRAGTADMTTGPAMTREEAKQAIEVGIETARDLVAAGNKALLTGEMGIANTTASAALISVFTGADPAEVTGRGTGINDETLARKTEVVRRAIELHQPDPADPVGVLAAVGGLEHAAMVGLLLGGASLRTPVILDGVSAGAAALVARAIAPEVLAACIAGHRSAEPGHVAALNKLGLRPLVDLDLRLGEGTGALLALPMVQSTARAMHEVATFDAAGVTEK